LAFAPQLKVRVVNVVDLMTLCPPDRHPHGMPDDRFISLFTANKPVIFAFHGYPGVIHQLIHGRPEAARFHARGYIEEGTTTTPFDMVVLNKMSRVHLCMDAVRYAPDIRNAGELLAKGEEVLRNIVLMCTSILKICRRFATGYGWTKRARHSHLASQD
jgi:xylulose-5-phosphate/fructose-6-phosphate phosphoketolase